MDLILHSDATSRIYALRGDNMPQALLLSGPMGVGLKTIAVELCSPHTPEIIVPQLKTRTSTIATIGIEAIRELYESTRSKSISHRYIVIDDADAMSHGAQNSFLKLLEEPNPSTYFILTSHRSEVLLPTIRSRVQSVYIPEPSPHQIQPILERTNVDTVIIKQIQFIARGLPAEAIRLLGDKKYLETATKHTIAAKKLIESSPAGMLAGVIKFPASRADQLSIIERMIRLLALNPTQTRLHKAERLLEAYERTRTGANAKLQIARAMLQ